MQFIKGFGGLARNLRYKIDADTHDDLNNDDNDNDEYV